MTKNETEQVVCFIGLGSNLNEPVIQLQQAVQALRCLPGCEQWLVSPFYASRPMGPQDQPDYVNAVVQLTTRLSPLALLDHLQQIEQQQGRLRVGDRWGPRTLDLDLLLYGQQVINTERLIVPHYGLAQRNFVLYPLADLVGKTFIVPGVGQLSSLVAMCEQGDLKRLNAS